MEPQVKGVAAEVVSVDSNNVHHRNTDHHHSKVWSNRQKIDIFIGEKKLVLSC